MPTLLRDIPPIKRARIAGLLYLLFIGTLVCSSLIHVPLLSNDPTVVLHNIHVYGTTFRIGFMCELSSTVLFLLAAWALYVLLRPVHETLSLLFVLLNLGGVAVQCTSTLSQFAPLLLFSEPSVSNGLSPAQLQALASFFTHFGTAGFMVANVFYGVWLLPLGYLVLRSGFLPRTLGILLLLDCCAVLIWVFQFFFLPKATFLTYALYPVMFVAEFSLALWLLIRGIDQQRYPALSAP